MVKRQLSAVIRRYADEYPVVTLTGPRQSGKTTLCKSVFGGHQWLNLVNPSIRREAETDPVRFLARHGERMILDEIQYAPELLSYIQDRVDRDPAAGRFILTGSANLEVMEQVSETLAGRTALATLLPFSWGEIYYGRTTPDLDSILFTGFYPRIFDRGLRPHEALSFYLRTYVERDVRKLLNVRDLSRFDLFVRMCAGRCGRLLNMNSLGNDVGLNHVTVAGWLSVLEASFITFFLRPHHMNFNKRMVKSPKLYFYDCGLACNLLNVESAPNLAFHPLRGPLFESFIVAELFKQRLHAGNPPNLYFWRDNVGHEIDCLFDFGVSQFPVEIKSGSTITSDFFKNLRFYRKINPGCHTGAVIYGGDRSYREDGFYIVSYQDIRAFESIDASCQPAI